MTDNLDLVGEIDATVWTKKWLETIAEHPGIPTDEGSMIAWFANAIMSGYEAGRKFERERSKEELVKSRSY